MKKTFAILLFACLALCSCKKDEEAPLAYVNFSINPDSPAYSGLNTVGGYEYLTGGYCGVVVFRTSWTDFVAFERGCPIDNNTGVEVDTDNSVIMFCPKCGSQFVYTDGTPIQGPARSPLRQYNAVYSGGMLHVYN